MAKPLDGTAFYVYSRRLGFSQETQDLLTAIRTSLPNRTPGNHYGNMPVWYPSKKMQCIIKAESHKVEFAFLLEAEHDDNVLEIWDQPPAIPLEYQDRRGCLQRPMHTADYFVFSYDSAGWQECKPTQELLRQAQTRPNRYLLDEQGIWRCPPGEAFAARYGLTYRVRASDEINWAAQENWQFLEDYYQDLDHLAVSETDLTILCQVVDEHPGITLADLRLEAPRVSTDAIHIAIAKHYLYVDLSLHRLSEPDQVPVFRDREIARALLHRGTSASGRDFLAHPVIISPGTPITWDGKIWQIANVGQQDITLVSAEHDPFALPYAAFEKLVKAGKIVGDHQEMPSSITPEGRILLEQASDIDLATAIFRNRVINPEQYEDEEQAQSTAKRAAVPQRTRFRWRQWYRTAEIRYGSGFIGLLPRYHNCGSASRLAPESRALIEEVLKTHYDTVTRKPRRGAYGEYLKRCEEQEIAPTTQRTFYTEVQRHKARYDQTVAREGTRAAYSFKDYHREAEKTLARHGTYAWSLAHLDHTELNVFLCDSRTGQLLGKCWLTLLILSHPRRIAAYSLTFDPPSYRSCLMVLRLCVKRYGRLPTAIVVDGGPEFHSVYFEQLLALYRVRKQQRPSAEPRFGSPQERLFGTLETEVLDHLLGNTQATQQPRKLTKATDPRQQAVWTLPALAERVQQWADEEYDTIAHPALGMTPRAAYEQSLERNGARLHKLIPFDETFLMATLPTTRKGTALVQPGVGVRMNYLDYWCEAMRDPTVERTQVKVRYDPFNVSVGFAYIDGKWRQCFTPYNEFAGCSERELHLLAEELRERNRLLHGREQIEVTQKQLATFRRENDSIETILRQQRHDRETRTALAVLEGKKRTETAPTRTASNPRDLKPDQAPDSPETADKPRKLLVFKRITI
jgi:hypothetical protein